MSVTKPLKLTLSIAFAVGGFNATAQDTALSVIYINGIQNTLNNFIATKVRIQDILNESVNHVGATKRNFRVTGVWNPQGWSGEDDLLETIVRDKKRLFVLKTAEEKFSASFVNLLSPFDQSLSPDIGSAQRVVGYLDNMLPGANYLEASGRINAGDLRRTQFATNSLVANAEAKAPAVIVAHSQGNLLANLAYAKLIVRNGSNVNNLVKVVNVANTSFWSVNGLNFTHAGDAALFKTSTLDFSLESLPVTENWSRTTPRCQNDGICPFLMSVPPFGAGSFVADRVFPDTVLEHSITQTYLSNGTVPLSDSQRVPFTSGANRFRDRFEDFVYAAAGALSVGWAGNFSVTGCTQKAADQSWAWEVPCFNTGPYVGAVSSSFFFDDLSSTVILQSEIQGFAKVRKQFAARWRSTDSKMTLSLPVTILYSFNGDGAFRRLQTSRDFELITTERTASRIAGTFTIRSTSGLGLTYGGFNSTTFTVVPTVTSGTWFAIRRQLPSLNMNGFDLCVGGSATLGEGKPYIDLSKLPLSVGAVSSLNWAEGVNQPASGSCTFGLLN